ncbi:unnamed protein product [Ectocarpus sp. 12 AP-2014]
MSVVCCVPETEMVVSWVPVLLHSPSRKWSAVYFGWKRGEIFSMKESICCVLAITILLMIRPKMTESNVTRRSG